MTPYLIAFGCSLAATSFAMYATWRFSRVHFAREWHRKIMPAVLAKGVAQGFFDGHQKGYSKGLTAGKIEMVKRYGQLDGSSNRTVEQSFRKN